MEGFNNCFFTNENNSWFVHALFWFPDPLKPLVLLPCGRAEKTRAKYGRKKISEGFTHNLMKAVRSDDHLEKVIISEPLTIIPYEIEMHPLRPDYNLPARDLSIQSEFTFQIRLGFWLSKLKRRQPERKFIYYVGATHHYFILFALLVFRLIVCYNSFIFYITNGGHQNLIKRSFDYETSKEYVHIYKHNGIYFGFNLFCPALGLKSYRNNTSYK